jgi:hypothetical protein
MQTITVKPTSNNSGRPQRKATGAGRQRTVSVDLGKSEDWNAGNAAGTLGLALGWKADDRIERGDVWGTFVNLDR